MGVGGPWDSSQWGTNPIHGKAARCKLWTSRHIPRVCIDSTNGIRAGKSVCREWCETATSATLSATSNARPQPSSPRPNPQASLNDVGTSGCSAPLHQWAGAWSGLTGTEPRSMGQVHGSGAWGFAATRQSLAAPDRVSQHPTESVISMPGCQAARCWESLPSVQQAKAHRLVPGTASIRREQPQLTAAAHSGSSQQLDDPRLPGVVRKGCCCYIFTECILICDAAASLPSSAWVFGAGQAVPEHSGWQHVCDQGMEERAQGTSGKDILL